MSEDKTATAEAANIWKDSSNYYQSQYSDDNDKRTKANDSNKIDLLVFRPNMYFPKLTIYNECNFLNGAKVLVDRRLVFIVTSKFDNQWYHVKSGQINGWIHLTSQMTHHKSIEFVDNIFRYELWRGNNYFFLRGRCMTTYDLPLFR